MSDWRTPSMSSPFTHIALAAAATAVWSDMMTVEDRSSEPSGGFCLRFGGMPINENVKLVKVKLPLELQGLSHVFLLLHLTSHHHSL